MKKILILTVLLLSLMITGCSNIQNYSVKELVEVGLDSSGKSTNQVRTGYKYFLPKGMSISEQRNDFNEVIRAEKYNYYLYVDVVSYYNKVADKYVVNKMAQESSTIEKADKYGYYEINEKNNKSLIEIMYNYAKIEVIVDNVDVNLAIKNALSILSSIEYNDIILANLMGSDSFKYKDVAFNIFETKKKVEEDLLTADDNSGQWVKPEVPDSDVIN